MCHRETLTHTLSHAHTHMLPCFSQSHFARPNKSLQSLCSSTPSFLLFSPLFTRTTNYFPSHDQAAPSPHYQLIDRQRCFFPPPPLLYPSPALSHPASGYDSACRFHPPFHLEIEMICRCCRRLLTDQMCIKHPQLVENGAQSHASPCVRAVAETV